MSDSRAGASRVPAARVPAARIDAARAAAARAVTGGVRTITAPGWFLLVLTPVLLVAGYRAGWPELVATGFATGILLLIAVVHLLGRSDFATTLTVPVDRVVAGHPATASVALVNRSSNRLLGAEIEVPVGVATVQLSIPALARGDELERSFALPTERRAVLTVGPVRGVRTDPLGLLRREVVTEESHVVVVRPRTTDVPSSSSGSIRDLEGRASRAITDSDVSFHALREYVPGDDQRYIHWKSTARTGTHMVRQFEETRRSRLVVALSLAASQYAGDDEFELAVSAAASLGVRSIRDSSGVAVVVGQPREGRGAPPGIRPLSSLTRDRLLDDLAGVERSPGSPPLSELARLLSDRLRSISFVYLVCGSLTTASELRAAAAHLPPEVEVVAVIAEPAAVPGFRRSPGLDVLRIGYLDDLRLALHRAAAG